MCMTARPPHDKFGDGFGHHQKNVSLYDVKADSVMDNMNVVLVMCDQLRPFEVGCYGNAHAQTPHIDQLASEGVCFETAISNNPVCTPARSICMTGQYARTATGMLGNVHENPPNSKRIRLLDPTLPECFQQAGYETALIGKWHIDPQPQCVGFDTAHYPKIEHRHFDQVFYDTHTNEETVATFQHEYERQHVQRFLAASREKPFFLFYNISTPHQPIGMRHLPESFHQLFDPATLPVRENVPIETDDPAWKEACAFWFSVYTSADFFWDWHYKRPIAREDMVDPHFGYRDLLACYYAATTCTDWYVGALMQDIKNAGLADNTLLVFVSDHGDLLGSHGCFNKGRFYEEAIRIPMIWHCPKKWNAYRNNQDLPSLIDIAPTLLAACDVPIPDTMQGKSLLSCMQAEGAGSGPDAVYVECDSREIVLRTHSDAFVMHIDATTHALTDAMPKRYDIIQDPYQQMDIYGRDKKSDATLQDKLRTWHMMTPWLSVSE